MKKKEFLIEISGHFETTDDAEVDCILGIVGSLPSFDMFAELGYTLDEVRVVVEEGDQ